MKIKNLFAIVLALTLLVCTCVLPTSAKEHTHNNDIEIIILDENVSAETKTKIENYFATGEAATDDGVAAYGLTCTLLGHKLQNSIVEVTTHKVRATSPRCVTKTYDYDACTRCDYETSELIDTEYIVCCS